MSTAVARWVRATEDWNPADHPRAPGKAPGGIGGQFVSGLIHGLVGGHHEERSSPAVARMVTGRGSVVSTAGAARKMAAPKAPRAAKAAAKVGGKPKSLMSQMTVEQRRIARSYGLPDDHPLTKVAERVSNAGSEQEARDILRDLHDDDVKQIGREVGVTFPVGMSAEDRKQHVARQLYGSLAAFGSVGSLSTPAPAKKATAAQRMSRAAKPARDPAEIRAALNKVGSREEGEQLLQGLTIAQLREVSPVAVAASRNKRDAIDKVLQSETAHLYIAGIAAGAASFRHDESPAVAKMARGKAPKVAREHGLIGGKTTTRTDELRVALRSSGLPERPTSEDFDNLADRVSRLRTADQVVDLIADLNAGELNRLAAKFPGDVRDYPGGRSTVMKIPTGLSLGERRRWFAEQVKSRPFA